MSTVLATAGGGAGTLLVVGLVALLGYLAWCWAYPFKPCPSCAGAGTRSDGHGNYRLRECRRCGGKPYPRVGSRFLRRR